MRTFAFKPLCQLVGVKDIIKAAFTYLDSSNFSADVYNGIIWCSQDVIKPFAESSRKTFYVLFTDYFCLMLGNDYFKWITSE